MKRFLLSLTVLLVLLAAAVATLMRPPRALVDAWLVPRLNEATGLAWSLSGDTAVALYPVPKVRLEGVSVSDPGGALAGRPLQAAAIVAELAWAPLFSRQVQVTAVEIDAPVVDSATLSRLGVSRRNAASADPVGRHLPAVVNVHAGKLVAGGGAQPRSLVENVDAAIARKDAAGPLTITATFRANQRDGAATLAVAALEDLLAGKTSKATLAVKSGDTTLDLQGAASVHEGAPRFAGRITGATASLRALIALATPDTPTPGEGLGAAKLDGELTADGNAIALASATMAVDQTTARGDLKVDLNGTRPRLTGKIAADQIDVGLYAPQWVRRNGMANLESASAPAVAVDIVPIREVLRAHLEALAGERSPADNMRLEAMTPGAIRFSDAPVDLSALDMADLDLDLTVARMAVGRLVLAMPQLTTKLAKRQLTLSAPGLGLMGGKANVTVSVDGSAPAMTIETELSGDELEAEPVFGLLAVKPVLAGKAALKAKLAAKGRSARDLVSAVTGNVNVESKRGNIVGWDIERNWKQIIWNRDLGDYDGHARTPYDLIRSDVTLAAGEVRQSTFELAGPVLAVQGGGTATLVNQRLDLRARLRSAIPPLLRIPVRLSGPWSKPRVGLDDEDGGLLSVIASFFDTSGATLKSSELDDPEVRRLMRRAKDRNDQARALDSGAAEALRILDEQLH